MPELPEVETVRQGLEPFVTGATVRSVHLFRDSAIRLTPGGLGEFSARLVGARVTGAARRGKFLWMPLDEGTALSAHLGMSGQFRVHETAVEAAPEPHPHCRVRLGMIGDDGRQFTLDFLDQRTFGYLHVEDLVPTPDGLPGGSGSVLAEVPLSVAHIGRDVLDPAVTASDAIRLWRRGTRGIKQVLLDQMRLSGVGNIYADEALWAARVHPERPASSLPVARVRELFEATRAVMAEALAQGGTSFDKLCVNVNGESGYFSRFLRSYSRAGEPCYRCGALIVREPFMNRSSYFCPRCQRRPRR